VTGINSVIWYSDDAISICFLEAVAQSCGHGIVYSDVVITDVVDMTRAAAKVSLRASSVWPWMAAQSTTDESITVSYVISQAVRDFNSSESAYKTISAALITAVEEGYFTAYLRGFAQIMGVDSLAAASSTQIHVLSFTPTPTMRPTGRSKAGLSSGSIAAIAVCSALGFGVFGMLICCSAREESSKTKKEPSTEPAAVEVTPKKALDSGESIHDDDLVDGNKDIDKDKELKKGKGRDRHRRILEGNLNSSFKGNSESHRAPPKPPRPPKNSFRNHPYGGSVATALDTRPERPMPAPAGSFDYEGGREDSKEYSC
jgi:hypothetical protein